MFIAFGGSDFTTFVNQRWFRVKEAHILIDLVYEAHFNKEDPNESNLHTL